MRSARILLLAACLSPSPSLASVVAPPEIAQLRAGLEAAISKTKDAVARLKDPATGELQRQQLGGALREMAARVDSIAASFPDDDKIRDAAYRQALAAEDWDRARRYAGEMLRRAPDARSRTDAVVALGQVSLLRGDYERATAEARQALARDPRDKRAMALYQFAKDRSTPSQDAGVPRPLLGESGAVPAAPSSAGGVPAGGTGPERPMVSFRRSSPPVPPLGATTPSRPDAPDFWDKQLLGPMLRRSDDNPVARQYLSPLIREGKMTIRLVREKDAVDLKGNWGDYDAKTSVIRYNLDKIDRDIGEYDDYQAKHGGARVAPISGTRALDPTQIGFLVGRFLPLAVHEAGGHGTDGENLRRLLGTASAPLNKDTEIRAWRLEAASIVAERRRDPRYLTEATEWAIGENKMTRRWQLSRAMRNPGLYEDYLDHLGYGYLPNVSRDPAATKKRYGAAVSLVQHHCRISYDEACREAVDALESLYDPDFRDEVDQLRMSLELHPEDARTRGQLMNALFDHAVADDRLDDKGIAVVAAYHREQDARVTALENAVDPRTWVDRLRSWGLH